MELVLDKKQLSKTSIRTLKLFSAQWERNLKDFNDDVVDDATVEHEYRNRSGLLSSSNKSIFTTKKDEQVSSIFNTAPYSIFVEHNTNDKWIAKAMTKNRRSLERDLEQVPKELR